MLASFAGTWLAISYLGATPYASVLLITGLAQLLPFADFGVGAAVINTISTTGDNESGERLRFSVLVSAQRVLVVGCSTVLAIAIAIAAIGAWPQVLGDGVDELGANANLAALAFFCVFASFVFFQLGYRALTGAGKNYLVSILGGGASALTLVLIGSGVIFNLNVIWFVVAPTLAAAAIAFAACLVATRVLGLTYRGILAAVPQRRRTPQIPLRGTAIPMLVILVALPVLVFSHRLILSHVSTPAMLTEYSLASQVYAPAWGIVTGTLIALWPVFAAARPPGSPPQLSAIARPLLWIASGGIALGLVFAIALPFLTGVIGHSEATASWSLAVCFGSLIAIQTAYYPVGVYLARGAELRFQAWCVTAMLVVCLPLSVVAAAAWGAPGPVAVTAAAILLFQAIPALWYMQTKGRNSVA